MVILSHMQAGDLLNARMAQKKTVEVSLDLNLTKSEAAIEEEGARLPDGQLVPWDTLVEITENVHACYVVAEGKAEKVQFYSEELKRFYSLIPTRRAPSMLLSGLPMHRIKNVSPDEDTRLKIKTISPVQGSVLDICTGLGYTAIAAAKTATDVTTIELDPTVLEVCRRNPWSRELFDNPKIKQLLGDATEVIETLEDESYARVFHDPPMFRIAGELYSGDFYTELHRVLKRGGRLFHYIGDMDSTSGRVTAKGVVKRLQEAGFQRVDRRNEAFGIIASK